MTREEWPLERVLEQYRDGDEHGWDEEFAHLREIHLPQLWDLAGHIAANGMHTPVLLGTDGRVWDGHHRLCVAQHLGLDTIPVEKAVCPHKWDIVALTWDTRDYLCSICGQTAQRKARWVREDGMKRLLWPTALPDGQTRPEL